MNKTNIIFSCLDEDEGKGFTLFEENNKERIMFSDNGEKRKFYPENEHQHWTTMLVISILILLAVVATVAGCIGYNLGKASVKVSSETSVESQSKAPAESQPETPAESQPETPAESQPETPAEDQSEAPAESQPETPAEDQSEAPAQVPTEDQEEVLTAYYYGKVFDVPLNAFDDRNRCVEEPYILPYDGDGPKQEIILIIPGKVDVLQVNRSFETINKLSFSYLEDKDVTSVSFYMEVPEYDPSGDYRYYFEVTTADGISKFFGIRYVDPKLL